MNQLSPDQTRVAEIHGQLIAQGVVIKALLLSIPEDQLSAFAATMGQLSEQARALYLAASVPEELLQSFDRQLQTMLASLAPPPR